MTNPVKQLQRTKEEYRHMDRLDKRRFWSNGVLNNALYILMAIFIIYTAIQNKNFVSPGSIVNIISLVAASLPMALGIAGCIVLTGTDLSGGRVVGLTAAFAGALLQNRDISRKLFPNLPAISPWWILLTILIKMLLYPLTVKQVKSMKAMQELSPKMKKIQEKYKDNPQVMQQKVGALYKEAGVNPLAGCLPLLIQMPILMGMYYALYNFTYPTPESAAFLWLPNMSDPDPYYILPVLSALTTFLQQKQTTTEMNQQMKIMMTVMPLFIGWISLNFPSGLVLYWVTMNIVQITQQWWMYRHDDKKKEAA